MGRSKSSKSSKSTRRDFLKLLASLGVGIGVAELAKAGIANAQLVPTPEVLVRKSDIHAFPADVIVFRDGDYAVAVARGKGEIYRSKDHAYVLQRAIDYLVNECNGRGTIDLGLGDYIIDGVDVIMQYNGVRIQIVGHSHWDNEWYPKGSHIILRNDGQLKDYGEKWGFLKFVNITITVEGTYTKTPLYFPKTIVEFENCLLRATYVATEGYFLRGGSGGPPGKPAIWRNVSILDGRKGGTVKYHLLMYIWYEGFVWDGGSIIINQPDEIIGPQFLRVVGNTYAELRNIDVYIGKMVNRYECFFIFDVDARLINVELPKYPDYVAYQIREVMGTARTVFIDNVRQHEAGPLIIPTRSENIRLIFGGTYCRCGVATLSGDGTTTVFKVGTHDLKPDVTDPSRVIVNVTPASKDAINASPCVGYLQDDDDDGVYESIYVKFASAPASGTDNVKVVWEVKYIG